MFVQFGSSPSEDSPPKQEGMAIGIDLGTTHSVVAVHENGSVRVLETSLSAERTPTIVPSLVVYDFKKEDVVLVGEPARGHPKVIQSIKRKIGREKSVSDAESTQDPIRVSAEILKALKQEAQRLLAQDVTQAVITVPAYFDEAARQETKQAAELAGLKVLRLLNEPTAAALAYGLDQGVEGTYAVYDLGGGTFDISLIRFTKGVFQVLATAGDTQLGGDDIDEAILCALEKSYPFVSFTPLYGRHVKEFLSVSSDFQDSTQGETIHFSGAQLKELMSPFLDRTYGICNQALQDAQLTHASLQGVILVGGSTKMPLVREGVEAYFGQKPLTNVNPDEVVAVGAALQAASLTQGSDTLLLDVTPLSLGLETYGGIVEKIIHRNTPIPVAIAQDFTTYQDGQTGMEIHVLQGEREFATDCRSLAQFSLHGIPAMKAGIARVRVTFQLDVDGLLTVKACEQTTGIEQAVEIKPSYGLQEEDFLQILRDNFEHGLEDIEQRLLVETRVHAEQFLSMLETALVEDGDLLPREEQEKLAEEIKRLKNLLNSAVKDDINKQLTLLEEMSDSFAEQRMNRHLAQALAGQSVTDVA